MASTARDLLAKSLGQRVKEHRDEAGYSQEELAFFAGITRNALGSIERGDALPDVDTIVSLAFVLGTRVEELLPEDYSPFVDRQRLDRIGQIIGVASDTNTAGVITPVKTQRRQASKVPGRKSREGGFSTTSPRPAATAKEAA